jgi:hypothetical protein
LGLDVDAVVVDAGIIGTCTVALSRCFANASRLALPLHLTGRMPAMFGTKY